MEAYREAQREKWLRAQQSKESAQSAAAGASSSSSVGAPQGGYAAPPDPTPAAAATSSSAASSDGPKSTPSARRVHILPVGNSPAEGNRRLELLTPILRQLRSSKTPIKTGLILKVPPDHEFVVVKSDPDEALLMPETDYFVEGIAVKKFEKVQFICMWDYEQVRTDQDATTLFQDYILPHFRDRLSDDMTNIVTIGDIQTIRGLDFQIHAATPSPPEMGIIDKDTMVYVDWDSTPEFSRIHIVPFQDTLPAAYQFDIFNDYLKPYLTRNKLSRFTANDQFTYQGVQFKVVCCEPDGPARIGKNTTIYCEGVLHPSLRNLLPPELLEQLSTLPPGLQMLLLNTEALAGGYEERLMEVQEMLTRRRGMASDVIDRIEQTRWSAQDSEAGQQQCMVCLCDFEENDEVRRLPCRHVFHASCIDEWLRRCTDCPICKTNVDAAVRQY
eukprot:TRINITY_DN97599_c0_g1_i1.p1 TRINITY_DN97599_c0_g1~~TRINITY_DN97599_c0_g1_i1.p1  ORF type:complete len:443 (+),score=99.81 TRINITY_DN97599_c0_g1_i1:65-1393(+)